MSMFAPIFRLFNIGGLSNSDTGYQLGAIEKTATSAGISVTDERALKVSAVWACVQLIANSVASLPLNVYRRTRDGQEPLKSRHFLTDLLQYRPNQYMKSRDFRMAMTVQMALWANAYAEIVRSNDRPVALMPLRPGRMAPFITNDGELTYHYSTDTGVKVYAKDSILHMKGFGTDGIVGAERNNFAREAYGLSVSADTYAAKQFANGGRPGGVLTIDQFLKPKQRDEIRDLYSGMSEGAANSNRLWVLEGGMKYEALDFSADQMQMIATRTHQLSEVARFFGVPDVMIGAGSNTSSAWPASFEQQMLYFLNFTIQAYLDEWECAIHDSMLPRGSDIFVDHDVSNFIKMDSTAKANYLAKLVQNGLASRNEARHVLRLPRYEGGDELTVQTNLVDLSDLGAIGDVSQTDQSTGELPTEVQQ
jgi:HK97 family phage portal protein